MLQGGLIVIVAAFRAGDWDNGIPLVYAGGALALIALLIGLPYRFATSVRGMGRFLLYLGLGAGIIVLIAGAFVGGNMSTEEAAVGLVPAAVVAFVGLVLAIAGSSRPFGGDTAPATEAVAFTDGLDGSVADLLQSSPPDPR